LKKLTQKTQKAQKAQRETDNRFFVHLRLLRRPFGPWCPLGPFWKVCRCPRTTNDPPGRQKQITGFLCTCVSCAVPLVPAQEHEPDDPAKTSAAGCGKSPIPDLQSPIPFGAVPFGPWCPLGPFWKACHCPRTTNCPPGRLTGSGLREIPNPRSPLATFRVLSASATADGFPVLPPQCPTSDNRRCH
jgi:hypothetical protein